MDAGVPFIGADELETLLAGTPVESFVAPPAPRTNDRKAAVEAQLDGLSDELTSIESGERWDDQLTLTVQPNGRAVLELRDMGGTPLHDHACRVLQRHSWPIGDDDVVIERPMTWT